jgi:hypothetical protein
MKTFNTQVCTTKEQSQRLLKLGLKKETSDCRWVGLVKDVRGNDIPTKKQVWFTRTNENENAMVCGFMRYDFIPSWSLHRLIALCPKMIVHHQSENEMSLSVTHNGAYYEDNFTYSTEDIECFDLSQNLYDNLIDCIEWLIKNKHFNEEYLEE